MKIEIEAPEIEGFEFVRFGKARKGDFVFENDALKLWVYNDESSNLYLIYRKVEEHEPEYLIFRKDAKGHSIVIDSGGIGHGYPDRWLDCTHQVTVIPKGQEGPTEFVSNEEDENSAQYKRPMTLQECADDEYQEPRKGEE